MTGGRAMFETRGGIRRRSIVIGVFLGMLLSVVPSGTAVPATPKVDTNRVLRYGTNLLKAQSTTFDPRISATAPDFTQLTPLYAPLMTYSKSQNKYTPYLAQSVTVVDTQTIKVALRADAKFDNGQPVTAADAKATIETTVKNQASGRCNGCSSGLSIIGGIEVTDSRTFLIRLTSPGLGIIYDLLIGRETYIVPATAGAEQNTKPVGNGPFKFVSFTPGQKAVFEKSSTFFDAKNVRLKGIEFIHLSGGTPQTNALLAGDVDLADELDATNSAQLKAKNLVVQQGINPDYFFFFDMCKQPGFFFNDKRVRQALAYGTDRVALNNAVSQGMSLPAYQQFAAGDPRYDEKITKQYKYNPTKAKKLLRDAGVKEGTTLDILVTTTSSPQYPVIALVLKDQWAKIGINVNIVQTRDINADWLRPVLVNKPVLAPGAVLAFQRPGVEKIKRLFGPGGGQNTCNYSNPQLDQLATELLALVPTSAAATAKWKQAQQIIADDVPLIPLMFLPTLRAWDKSLTGITDDTYVGAAQIDWVSMYFKPKSK